MSGTMKKTVRGKVLVFIAAVDSQVRSSLEPANLQRTRTDLPMHDRMLALLNAPKIVH